MADKEFDSLSDDELIEEVERLIEFLEENTRRTSAYVEELKRRGYSDEQLAELKREAARQRAARN